jgi:DNA repair exonuclease SbcCD ATPase subunit
MKVSALKKVFENQTPQSTLIIPSRSHRRSVSTSFIAQETLEEHIQLVKSPRDILQLVGDSTAQQRYFGSADELQPPVQVVSTNNDTKKQILELEQTLLDVKTENKLLAAETEGYLERERTLSQTLSNIRDENEKLKQELLVKEKSANEHTQEAIQTLSALEEENKKLNEDIQMKDKTTVELQSTIERLLLELKQKDEQLENLRQQNTKLSTFSHTIQHLPEQDETSEECVTVRVKHAPNDSILSNESLDVLRESPVERTNENYYDEDTESSWGLDIDVNNELLENKAAIESDLDKIEDECENTVQQDVEKVDLMDIEKTPAT